MLKIEKRTWRRIHRKTHNRIVFVEVCPGPGMLQQRQGSWNEITLHTITWNDQEHIIRWKTLNKSRESNKSKEVSGNARVKGWYCRHRLEVKSFVWSELRDKHFHTIRKLFQTIRQKNRSIAKMQLYRKIKANAKVGFSHWVLFAQRMYITF